MNGKNLGSVIPITTRAWKKNLKKKKKKKSIFFSKIRYQKTFKKMSAGNCAGAVTRACSKCCAGAGADNSQKPWARLFAIKSLWFAAVFQKMNSKSIIYYICFNFTNTTHINPSLTKKKISYIYRRKYLVRETTRHFCMWGLAAGPLTCTGEVPNGPLARVGCQLLVVVTYEITTRPREPNANSYRVEKELSLDFRCLGRVTRSPYVLGPGRIGKNPK